MKLNSEKIEIESSGEMQEKFFSIDNLGMIFDILRNKMYGNPILAICREYTCNARDAHREVGKSDIPCEIQLPTYLEPNYIIRDFGPGISPDRIENIFIKYTASTKRNDNLQTGGFGLGSKTGFSYSDSFTVETIVDGVKYNYVCFVDETKVGKITLMSKEITDSSNGTAIKIPVKPQDFRFFIEGTEFVTRHWDVKPVIKGGTIHYQVFEPSLQGKGWMISKQSHYNYNANREIKLIIDGIEYPLDYSQTKTFADTAAIDSTNGTTFLYFGVGELNLSANRESVHLDKDTKEKIKKRIDAISADIVGTLQAKVNSYASLWEANMKITKELSQTFDNRSILQKLTWNGNKITIGQLRFDETLFTFSKGRYRRGISSPDKLTKSSTHYLDFSENVALYINDLGMADVGIKGVQPAFDADLKLKHLYVVHVDDPKKVDDVIKKYDLDKLGVQKLSQITKAPKKYTVSGVRLLVFKFNFSERKFKQVSIDSMEEDTNKKIICTLEKDAYNNSRRAQFSKSGVISNIANDTLSAVMGANAGYSLYGVDETIPADKIAENFEGFENLEDFLNEKVAKNKKIDYAKIKYALSVRYSLPDRELRHFADISKLIKDTKSEYLSYLQTLQNIKDIIEKEGGLLHTYESVMGPIPEKDVAEFTKNNPQYDFKKLKQQINKQYPLLDHIDYYQFERLIDPIVNYINMIDKENKNQGASNAKS